MNIENIKLHVKKYQTYYIVVGVVGTAAGCGYLGYRFGATRVVENEINSKINQVLSYKPKATIEVYVEALGDPGNIIQDTTTGVIYASQRQAARELGLEASRVSEQVRGLRDHVNGHKFEFLAKAIVPERAA